MSSTSRSTLAYIDLDGRVYLTYMEEATGTDSVIGRELAHHSDEELASAVKKLVWGVARTTSQISHISSSDAGDPKAVAIGESTFLIPSTRKVHHKFYNAEKLVPRGIKRFRQDPTGVGVIFREAAPESLEFFTLSEEKVVTLGELKEHFAADEAPSLF